MVVAFNRIVQGQSYGRPQLAKLWGYESFHAFGRGIFKPRFQNVIVLFITKEKQSFQVQYEDKLEGDYLYMQGETNHQHDKDLAESLNRFEVHLFYRERHHEDFTYKGQVFFAYHEPNARRPSKFVFALSLIAALAFNTGITQNYLLPDDDYQPEEEGKKKISRHIAYERSLKNRARAIEIHGTTCMCCDFDFDSFYGAELAKHYIEVHHVNSITSGQRIIDPEKDLVVLCANCHRVIHRNPVLPLDWTELKSHLCNMKAVRGREGLK